MHSSAVSIEVLTSETELTQEKLLALAEKHSFSMLMVEYNGTWRISTLTKALPRTWPIVNHYHLCSGRDLRVYNNNIRELVVDKISAAGTVLSIMAAQLKKKALIVLFVLAVVGMLGMGYMSTKDFADPKMNWIAQGINCVSQAIYLLGVWRLHKAGLRDLKLKTA